MNLLVDPTFEIHDGDRVSLSGMFAALSRGDVRGFKSLRPHQRPAWHMFLVQLGTLALWNGRQVSPPKDERSWTNLLRALTPEYSDDSPWRLVVNDWSMPAFLQPPAPDGLSWSNVPTPDNLDMLITARNHDLKQTVARFAAPEHWVYALVSLQTCEGYNGSGNNGIARMNGGSSSRPLLGLAPASVSNNSIDPSAWWKRDVTRLLAERANGNFLGTGSVGGSALIWLLDWPESDQLELGQLDPLFIEVCRRIRLIDSGETLSALRSRSKATRIAAKAFKGNTGDPWASVEKKNGKNFTLSSGNFDYRCICSLLFSGDWKIPLLAMPGREESGDMLLVAEAFSRGNSKTEGFKSRIVPAPATAVSLFSSKTVKNIASAQLTEIATFDDALKTSLAIAAASGNPNQIEKKHWSRTVLARRCFDREADRLFFHSLWRRASKASASADLAAEAKLEFLANLFNAAKAELEIALPAIPISKMNRPKAETQARRAFYRKTRHAHPELFNREKKNAAA